MMFFSCASSRVMHHACMTTTRRTSSILPPATKLVLAAQDVLRLRPQTGLDVVLLEDLQLAMGTERMRDRAHRLTTELSTDGRAAGDRIAIERLRNAVREYDASDARDAHAAHAIERLRNAVREYELTGNGARRVR
jgi:hypothetical protein